MNNFDPAIRNFPVRKRRALSLALYGSVCSVGRDCVFPAGSFYPE
ncbi:hypothetical protein HMPREF3293_01209 [Christensenella minuta]|uniref:Uncharacterized protein n=1 Tax=Christensenella minuta TaxID=626937 RepID=A0A136Q5H9_9FIRM|nr:hypothetical protein HMPREF3293_01209 [Christensenella minuta]